MNLHCFTCSILKSSGLTVLSNLTLLNLGCRPAPPGRKYKPRRLFMPNGLFSSYNVEFDGLKVLLCYFLTILYLQRVKVTPKRVKTLIAKAGKILGTSKVGPKYRITLVKDVQEKIECPGWRCNYLLRRARWQDSHKGNEL